MRLHTWTAAFLLGLLAAQAQAFSTPKPGQVIEVALEQLHPTQAVVGFDQIYYSLGLFADKPAKVFDEYCETNGQGAAGNVPKKADLHQPSSFTCKDPVGTHPDDMKTVVVGPGGQLYLTDGHHSFTTLWEVPGGGAQGLAQGQQGPNPGARAITGAPGFQEPAGRHFPQPGVFHAQGRLWQAGRWHDRAGVSGVLLG